MLLPCKVIVLHRRHGAAPPGSRWGGVRPDWGGAEHVLCSPVPVLNHSFLDASPCGSRPFLSPNLKAKQDPRPTVLGPGPSDTRGLMSSFCLGGDQREVVSPSAA